MVLFLVVPGCSLANSHAFLPISVLHEPANMAVWYASTNLGKRDFRARFVKVNQDIMSVSD